MTTAEHQGLRDNSMSKKFKLVDTTKKFFVYSCMFLNMLSRGCHQINGEGGSSVG